MSTYRCERCGAKDNTALTNYWHRQPGEKALCSWCDPLIAQWHDVFPYQPMPANWIHEGEDPPHRIHYGEREQHDLSPDCGCNPDYLGEGDDAAWYHHSLKP